MDSRRQFLTAAATLAAGGAVADGLADTAPASATTDLSSLPAAVQAGILTPYAPGSEYQAGDQVVIDNRLYEANTPIALAPETPNLADWTLAGSVRVDLGATPAPPTTLGSAGTDASRAASRNHSHPLGTLGRAMAFGGPLPPSYGANSDVVLDGHSTGNVSDYAGLAAVNNAYPYVRRFGSTYVAQGQNLLYVRRLTLAAGVTLVGTQGASAGAPGLGNGLVIIASESITIDGTIRADGLSARGATGAGTLPAGEANFNGGGGGDGATGAGQPGQYAFNAAGAPFVGGNGGNGGAAKSGGGAGGSAAGTLLLGSPILQGIGDNNPASGVTYWRPFNASQIYAAGGGNGGGGGGGDGSHAGGGGGQGGGVVHLIAPVITIGPAAQITADGGDGADGTGGDSGGGGGGGGGLIVMDALSLTIPASARMRAAGGHGGDSAGSGQPGLAGQANPRFQDPPVSDGGWNLGSGFLLRQWQ